MFFFLILFYFSFFKPSCEAYASSLDAEKVYAFAPLERLSVEGVHLPCSSHFWDALGLFMAAWPQGEPLLRL